MAKRIETVGLSCFYGNTPAVADVSVTIEPHSVTALIGPSGCGKSTFLRALNRMHEVIPGARVTGRVRLDEEEIYHSAVDPARVRRAVGMVFQKPNPFPTMSIYDNAVAGLRLSGVRRRAALDEAAERSLRAAHLWDEVRDRLGRSGAGLSGGQQQRLCIARAIAVEPDVLLMDEPCSALDPVSTLAIERLVGTLRDRYTIIIVTHDMGQAVRVSDTTGFFAVDEPGQPGRLVELGPTPAFFASPRDPRTADYLGGGSPRLLAPATAGPTMPDISGGRVRPAYRRSGGTVADHAPHPATAGCSGPPGFLPSTP